LRRLLFPIGPCVNVLPPTAALSADPALIEVWSYPAETEVPYFSAECVTAGIVEARRDKALHTQLAHVAERHRRPCGLLLLKP
jgi:hypothetical protein